MAGCKEPITPADFLTTLIPTQDIVHKAWALRFIQRKRKLDPLAFVLHIIFSMSLAMTGSTEELRRSFIKNTGTELGRSAFKERFAQPLDDLLAWLVGKIQARTHRHQPALKGPLARFKAVIAFDSTTIQVNNCLAHLFKGTRKAKAAIKVHTRICALSMGLRWSRITSGSFPDCKAVGFNWKDCRKLFLFDKGYQSATFWWRIDRVSAYFVTRLPGNYKPIVTALNRTHRGRSRVLVGKNLREQLKTLKRSVIDVQCSFRIHIRGYKGKRGRYEQVNFRVVGLWNQETSSYHLYVTNLAAKSFDAVLIGKIYSFRWEVELFYRAAKGGLGLDRVRRLKTEVRVKIWVRCALIRCCVAMMARQAARRSVPSLRVNPEAWVLVWRQEMVEWALDVLLDGVEPKVTWRFLSKLAADPNPSRVPLRERFLQGYSTDALPKTP